MVAFKHVFEDDANVYILLEKCENKVEPPEIAASRGF